MIILFYFLECNVTLLVYCHVYYSDRFRTAINVLGDSFGAGIVDHLSRNDLALMETVEVANNASKRDSTSGEENAAYTDDGCRM